MKTTVYLFEVLGHLLVEKSPKARPFKEEKIQIIYLCLAATYPQCFHMLKSVFPVNEQGHPFF